MCPNAVDLRYPCSMNRTSVNRHGIRGVVHEEQARSLGFSGFGACIFLLDQAKFRGFTGMGGGAMVDRARPAWASHSSISRHRTLFRHEKARSLVGVRAQFRLWIFSYHIFGILASMNLQNAVKSLVWRGSASARSRERLSRRPRRHSRQRRSA
jgi:hypothetical protein